MKISIDAKGNFKKTYTYLKNMKEINFAKDLAKYAEMGVEALSAATPKDSGKTASSWYFEIESNGDTYTINWKNSNVNKGVNIAYIIQMGHGTGTGGYVVGRDYINPAMEPILDAIAEYCRREVSNK